MARILIIDDDPDLLEMIKLLIERRRGHEAVLSADGESGVQKALEQPPDLAIVDVMMPGMTGYDVCRRLREAPETASIPILVLTARGQPVDREAALQAGADEHMAKPVTMTDLMEKIDGMLAEHSAAARPHTIAMASLKGGVGVTTLAANAAATLSRAGARAICLVDLCPSSGHLALHFGHRPRPDWSKLMREDVIDAQAVDALLLEVSAGLHLLASPIVPPVERALRRPTVKALLEILEERFDLVIVDTPSILNEATTTVLDGSSDTWLIVTADPAAVQTTFGTVRALGERAKGFPVILNEVTSTQRTSPDAIERVLKRPLAGTVPFDPDQAKALAQGKPLALHRPDAPLAKAVEELTNELI